MKTLRILVIMALAVVLPAQAQGSSATYAKSTSGVRDFKLGATSVKVLIDSATLGGGEMEMAHLTFAPGQTPRNHAHGRVEVLYVLNGELDHVVNGVSHVLRPGMAGIVRPGDQVMHRVPGTDSAKVLVIWAPGGELARIAPPRP